MIKRKHPNKFAPRRKAWKDYWRDPFESPMKTIEERYREAVPELIEALVNFRLPRRKLSFSGGFISSLKQRLALLLKEDKRNFIVIFNSFFSRYILYFFRGSFGDIFYSIIFWILLLPFIYLFYRLFLRFFLRIPLYLLAPFESFFENFLFPRLGKKQIPRLSSFYHSIIEPISAFFHASWGYPFWAYLYHSPWGRFLFWNILLDIYIKEPIRRRLQRPAWRFLGVLRRVEREVQIVGWEDFLLGLLRPITRPISRTFYRWKYRIKRWYFIYFTRQGRASYRILRGRRRLALQMLAKARRQERSFLRRSKLWKLRLLFLDLTLRVSLIWRLLRAQPLSCFCFVFFSFLAAIVFLLECIVRLFFPRPWRSRFLVSLWDFLRGRGRA